MNIVLLRGLVREKRHWGRFIEDLKQELPDHKIITPEIPGVGEFNHITTPPTFDEMIQFMRDKYLPELKGQETLIMALSLGGMIAKRWDELYPDDFKKLVLINTSFKSINPVIKRVQPDSIKTLIKLFMTPGVENRELGILRMVSNNWSEHPRILKEWINIQKEAPVSRKSFINQIRAALSFTPSKEKPKAQLLFLAAKKDRLCSYRCSEKLHNLWGGELVLHPLAGHDLPIDDGPWLIEKVKEFI